MQNIRSQIRTVIQKVRCPITSNNLSYIESEKGIFLYSKVKPSEKGSKYIVYPLHERELLNLMSINAQILDF